MMDFRFSNHTDTAPAIQVRNLTWPILLERQEVSTKNMTVGTPEPHQHEFTLMAYP